MVLKETDFEQFVHLGEGVAVLKELIFNSLSLMGRVWWCLQRTDF